MDKSVFLKPREEWTEEEKKAVDEAIQAFAKDVSDACDKHGMAYKAVLRQSQDGIRPELDIVAYEPQQKTDAS